VSPPWSAILLCVTSAGLDFGCVEAGEDGGAVFLDACQPTLVVPADDTTADERAGIAAAIALWSEVGGPPTSLAARSPAQTLVVGFQRAAPPFFGLYRPDRGDILINRTLSEPTARTITIAHEMGHAFGLQHVEGRPSLMNRGNLQIPPDDLEVQLILERGGACATSSELPAKPSTGVPAVQPGVLPGVGVGTIHQIVAEGGSTRRP
jgi:hypothetical protein